MRAAYWTFVVSRYARFFAWIKRLFVVLNTIDKTLRAVTQVGGVRFVRVNVDFRFRKLNVRA
jgi:hypothetical protein